MGNLSKPMPGLPLCLSHPAAIPLSPTSKSCAISSTSLELEQSAARARSPHPNPPVVHLPAVLRRYRLELPPVRATTGS